MCEHEVAETLSCRSPQKEGELCPAVCNSPRLCTSGRKSMLLTKLLKEFQFSTAALVFGDQNNASN